MNRIFDEHRQANTIQAFQPDDWQRTDSGVYVPATYRRRYDRPVAIDLFAGAGGFSLGLMQAGFHVVAAVEYDPWATITYTWNLGAYPMQFHFDNDDSRAKLEKAIEKNFKRHRVADPKSEWGGLSPEAFDELEERDFFQVFRTGGAYRSYHPEMPGCEHFFFGDIRNFTGQQILDAIGLQIGDVDCMVGGPPCQGFSKAGKRNVYDPRNSLVFEFARLVTEIKPETIVMENVPEIAKMIMPDGRNVVAAFAPALSDGGYASHDAITRSLLGDKNARVAVRQDFQESKAKDETQEVAKDKQLSLFDL